MAKAMLIMDMPSSCMGCNFLLCTENGKDYCQARETVKEVDLTKCDKPTWCPLREVKEGEWIFKYEGTYNSRRAYCSVCGKRSGIGGIKENQMKPYCPNCGAKMKVDEILGGGE